MAKDVFGKLSLLKRGGSTSRVIDLVSVKERYSETPGWAANPMFRTPRLNKSFVVKHTLRAWEREQLGGNRTTATKVIVPISDVNLDLGGHSIFVEDLGFDRQLANHLGISPGQLDFVADVERLRALAELPSFDPYLLHEFFRRNGETIDECYFVISDDELQRISRFVAAQIDTLVQKAMGADGDATTLSKSQKLAKVLFEDEDSPQLTVIREALRMTQQEYRDGVFGWKGTLYYSWRSGDCYADMVEFLRSLKGLHIVGLVGSDKAEIRTIMSSIAQLATGRWNRLKTQLDAYHTEFDTFVQRGDPAALKNFMTRAPELFVEMGEDLGRLQHVTAYWRFWTKDRRGKALSAQEAFDLLPDFEAALQTTTMKDAA